METNLCSMLQDEIFKATWRIGCSLPDEFLMETGHGNCSACSKALILYYCSVTERTVRKEKGSVTLPFAIRDVKIFLCDVFLEKSRCKSRGMVTPGCNTLPRWSLASLQLGEDFSQ